MLNKDHIDILVFKTDLTSTLLVDRATAHIQTITGIRRWNVDLQDVDKVLRIEAQNVSPRNVEKVLQQAGYYCEELMD